MDLRDTIMILFLEKSTEYDSSVNRFIKAVIRDGKILNDDGCNVVVSLYNKDYILYKDDLHWNFDLTSCRDENGEYIYNNRRPSRITQLRFWKWYENEFFRNKQERERVKGENTRIKQRVAEILKEGRSKKSVHPS